MGLLGIQKIIIFRLLELNNRGERMYKESIDLLKNCGIRFESGLTKSEMVMIEKLYTIKFPKSLRVFLMEELPISKDFYNWRNFEKNNVRFIKNTLYKPLKYIDNLAEEVYWCEKWGEEPINTMDKVNGVKERLKKAPLLLPVYSHRYMPEILDDEPPVLSVHGSDIIYYGKNLEDYLEIEFGGKEQVEIDFQRISPIPFWSEIM